MSVVIKGGWRVLQYAVWEGTRKPRKTDSDSLDEVMAKVYQIGRDDQATGKATRIRVFDREPGWLHPVWDSKQKEVK